MNQDKNQPSNEKDEFQDLFSNYRAAKEKEAAAKKAEAETACGETRLIGEPPKKKKPAPVKKPVLPDEDDVKEFVPKKSSFKQETPAETAPEPEADPLSETAALHFLERSPEEEETELLASHLESATGEEPPLPADPDEEEEDEEEDEDEDDEYAGMPKWKKFFCKLGNGILHLSFLPKALIYVAVVLIAAAYLSYYVIEIGNDVFALVTGNEEVSLSIPEEATEAEVSKLLLDKGLIDYEWPFKLFLKYYGKDEEIKFISGDHVMNMSMNYSQILNALTTVKRERVVVTLTFPEGFTVDEIIDLFLKNGIGTREGFVEAINNYPYKHEFVRLLDENGYPKDRSYRLEGYLYPDTYDFYTDSEEYLCINKLLNNFNDKVWVDWKSDYAEVAEKEGYSLDDIVTLASLIQCEGKTAEDFEYISQVFHNRLRHPDSFPNLESDATIQYAFELAGLEREKDSSQIDLSFDSPYNTYLHAGLTPGAICNPGMDSILAAIYPSKPLDDNDKEIDVYFFVSNNAGKTYYAATKSQHDRNVRRVEEENKKMKEEAENG